MDRQSEDLLVQQELSLIYATFFLAALWLAAAAGVDVL